MRTTDYRYARPSFAGGVARIMDFGSTLGAYNASGAVAIPPVLTPIRTRTAPPCAATGRSSAMIFATRWGSSQPRNPPACRPTTPRLKGERWPRETLIAHP